MLTRILSGSLVLIGLLSFSAPAQGQVTEHYTKPVPTQYHVYKLPEPTFRGDAGTAQGELCYTLVDFKQVLHMDNELWLAHGDLSLKNGQLRDLEISRLNLKKALTQQDAVVMALQKERRFLTDKWKSENKLRHKAENRPTFGSWVPWALSGVLAAGLGGVVLGLVVSE